MISLLTYLNKWAEPEARDLIELFNNTQGHLTPANPLLLTEKPLTKCLTVKSLTQTYAITVPVFDEPIDWWHQLVEPLSGQSIFWIWVFNCPEGTDSATKRANQERLAITLKNRSSPIDQPPFYLGTLNDHHSVLIVDRLSSPIPRKAGVGQARKIAADLALALFAHSLVKCHWFFNTDADAALPETYLNHPNVQQRIQHPNASALQMGFIHHPIDSKWSEATWCYDQYLRYHFRGLRHAASRYAITTIGSLMAVSMPHYAAVRGFPKRSAAEDFYLLNKLIKVGEVSVLDLPVVQLQGRPSHRVPFGTGPAILNWMDKNRDQIQVNAPQSYSDLKLLLQAIHNLIKVAPLSIEQLENAIPEVFVDRLKHMGIARWIEKTQTVNHPCPNIRAQAFDDWFDALKTWQFVKQCALNYPTISLNTASEHFLNEQRYPLTEPETTE